MEEGVELFHGVGPNLFPFGYSVEEPFYLSRKVVIDNLWEVLYKKIIHHNPDVCGEKFALIGTYFLRTYLESRCGMLGVADIVMVLMFAPTTGPFLYVLSSLYNLYCGGISRGSSDAKLF